MKSWRFHEFGNLGNLRLEEIPTPDPAPGEALVRLEYAALNPADRYMVMGQYPRPGTPPFSVGRDGCGTIERAVLGGRFREGDHVIILRSEIGVTRDGTLAQYVSVPEDCLAPLPDGWSPQEGAAGPLVHLTAWQALVDEGNCAPGKSVLITGASGGVGTAALVQAKAMGAQVVCLSRSEEKRNRLKEMGADLVFDSNDSDLIKHVFQGTHGAHFDIVIETLAGPFLQKSINLAGPKSKICVMGLLAGIKSEIVIGSFMFKRIHIVGIAVGDYSHDEAQSAWGKIVTTLERNGRRPAVDRVFPLELVPEAFDYLHKGPMGKVLVGPMN